MVGRRGNRASRHGGFLLLLPARAKFSRGLHVEETDECVAGLSNESHRHAGQGIQARTLKGQIQSRACDGRSIVGNAEDPRAVRCLTETIGLTNYTGRVGIARSLFLWYGLVGTNWV
jgi:hypothetical protein